MHTNRDAQIVNWLGRIGAAGIPHIAERFGMSRTQTHQRLQTLEADGLVGHRRILYAFPGMYWATVHGLRWQRIGRLRAFRVYPPTFEHAWQVASVAVALYREAPGWQLVSVREIRAQESDERRLLASAVVGQTSSRTLYHRPDLALVSPSGRAMPIEVELSIKQRTRLERICRGWARARHVDHVYYLATPEAARAVNRALDHVKATDRVTVLGLEDVAGLASHALAREQAVPGPQTSNLL